jgi:uncharacterized membrane protein (GlpM family)
MSRLRILVATIGFGGALLFGSAFAMSYAQPTWVEALAKNVIRAEVERRVDARIDALDAGWLGSMAARLSQRNEAEIASIRRTLADSVATKVARITAQMRDPSCECRSAAAAAVEDASLWRVSLMERAGERLSALIRTGYMDVSARLIREFRIFTAANALVLLFLGIAVVVRRNARLHLVPAAATLACSAVVVAWFYLFRQDWLHTILFSDYVGLAYFAYLAAPVLLVGDVALNRGRVTAHLMNAGSNAVGGALSVLPC